MYVQRAHAAHRAAQSAIVREADERRRLYYAVPFVSANPTTALAYQYPPPGVAPSASLAPPTARTVLARLSAGAAPGTSGGPTVVIARSGAFVFGKKKRDAVHCSVPHPGAPRYRGLIPGGTHQSTSHSSCKSATPRHLPFSCYA